ncbi:GyrI-like domain-containing protein [Clostridium sp. 'White wine YQ']|uniref:GyrI-like domain-containing protein n=1 Tax=Clostridium sp. 'White wine YQ' TaxID=3027474 RepID=UPI002367242F|nr:GyrI-like domain-containing protein [Clostridium sp. 'White wine YQ']MDD7793583.1 GyrI-like domain-containing protein [Clostridium sp. 'White wine YQ']
MAENKLDYKKEFKDLYSPKIVPGLIDVPEMKFIMVDGKGNPNDKDGEYQKAVEIIYALSYTIKMSKMGSLKPEGYFEYVVPPLEGLWWREDSEMDFTEKDKFHWTSMIRQPEFVTEEVFNWACNEVKRKKPHIQVDKARFSSFKEGLCVQIMHIGSYDNEVESIKKFEEFINNNSLKNDFNLNRKHHEIYISNYLKTPAEKLKTVIRHPVAKI